MANSFTYNSVDLADYGLAIKSTNAHILNQTIATTQLKDKAYKGGYKRPARMLELEVAIIGTSTANVISNLDSIKATLLTEDEHLLVFDVLSGRYFNAQLQSMAGDFTAPASWEGSLSFLCADPLAYATDQTSSDFNIDADPDTVIEAVGGTGMVEPLYTLTAGEALSDITLLLENETTDEELTWEGSLGDGEVLTIDVEHWIVYNEGTADMADVSGEFPRLQPGNNSIKVTGFSNTGTLNITYRDSYL